jgi:hypothetical protein
VREMFRCAYVEERRTRDGSGLHSVLSDTSSHRSRTVFNRSRTDLSSALRSFSILPTPAFRDSRDPVDPDGHFARLELRTSALQDPDRSVLGRGISRRTHPSKGGGERSLSDA